MMGFSSGVGSFSPEHTRLRLQNCDRSSWNWNCELGSFPFIQGQGLSTLGALNRHLSEDRMNKWLLLSIAISSETVATTALKYSDGFTRLIPSAIVLLGYAIAFYCLSLTLRQVPVGIAYAIWSGVGTTLITVFGWIFLGQKLDAASIAGIGLIVAGVVTMNVLAK
jgi:small multidrug resistance pump